MKKMFVLSLLLLGFTLVSAENMPKTAKQADKNVMEFKGIVIDNMCATSNKDKLGDFVKTHTKECALMANCQASGYSLYTADGQLIGFDKESNPKIVKFLKNKNSKLQVVLKAKKDGDMLHLVSIKNETTMKNDMKKSEMKKDNMKMGDMK
ncbi:MAG: hypothetical protein PHE88_03505 [Elusimicrobia bacterium]|nr:hypothetical protein [Elusimicrobiota bacterium]